MSTPPTASDSSASHAPSLPRVLGLASVIAIVVGEVIGSGIFFMPAPVAKDTGGYVGLILLLWAVCGLVNLCGALTTAELAAMFPRAGGTYVFLRETYGRMWSFLWAWTEFLVIRTGAIATLAVFAAMSFCDTLAYLDVRVPESYRGKIAVGMIALLGTVNILGTRWGSGVQIVATLIKASFVAFLAVLPFFALGGEPVDIHPLWPSSADYTTLTGIGSALAAIMWAYDGWGNATLVAEEVHDPERNLPRALIGGLLILIVLYVGANLAYHLTLTSAEIAEAGCPAIAVSAKLMPAFGAKLMTAMLLISLFGALNGNILSGPRVLFAVSRDHKFLAPFGRVHPSLKTPALAIAGVCAWSIGLILLGDLLRNPQDQPLSDVLREWTIFGGSIFYFTAAMAVFVLRKNRPDAPRPYRTWGYPVVPIIFLAFYVFLLVAMFLDQPRDRLIGLVLIALGVLVFLAVGQKTDHHSEASRAN